MSREAANLKISVLTDLIDTSSDSSDDELYEVIKSLDNIKRPKIENYNDVIAKYDEKEFRRNFRMSRSSFQKIKEEYEHSIFWNKKKRGLPSTLSDVQILMFLWFTGNKCVIRDVASRFGVAESTCHKICGIITNFLVTLGKQIIKFPKTDEEKATVAVKFEEINRFPGVIGAIDGSYIPMRAPAHKIRSTYINSHDQVSITLQGICDADKLFLDVFTGVPSKSHDSNVFSKSFISKELPNICGNEYHLIGDSAYSCRKWLMVPYKDYGNISPAEKNFNRKLSQCRVKIENSFGILKGRFRQLQKTEFNTVLKTSKFVIACCVLHNLCLINSDEWNEEEFYENNINFAPGINVTDRQEKMREG